MDFSRVTTFSCFASEEASVASRAFDIHLTDEVLWDGRLDNVAQALPPSISAKISMIILN